MEMTMAMKDKERTQQKHPKPDETSQLTHDQLDHVTGGSGSFQKIKVEYTEQKPDGTVESKK